MGEIVGTEFEKQIIIAAIADYSTADVFSRLYPCLNEPLRIFKY